MNKNLFKLGECPHRSRIASIITYQTNTPKLDESVFLADGARICGDVIIGAHSSIWFNTVVRADVHSIKIASYTNIQDGAIIHCTYQKASTIIGDYVSIAHLAMIHGCTIENGCLIGMGAIIMDGAIIGVDSIVGAGSVVTQGTIIPPRSLVLGSPAKVVRSLRDEEIAAILATTKRYVEYTKGYNFCI